MATIQQIFSWFQTGDVPTQEQFQQTFASLRHKDDRIVISDVEGLDNLLNGKLGFKHEADLNAHNDILIRKDASNLSEENKIILKTALQIPTIPDNLAVVDINEFPVVYSKLQVDLKLLPLYNDETIATYIEKRVDVNGNDVNYNTNALWYDGTPITDARIDDDIFIKRNGVFKRKMIDKNALLKINNIADLRQQNGYYEGQEITLLGYYVNGDKPTVQYKFTAADFDTLIDDGGSVIKSSKGSWIIQLQNIVDIRHFGVKNGDEILDGLNKIKTYLVSKGGGTIYYPNGNYLQRGTFEYSDNIHLLGESLLGVVVTATVPLASMYSTRDKYTTAVKVLSKNGRLRKGLYYYDLTPNGKVLSKGDIVRFKSSRRFTTDWDNGIAQRDYWLDAELLEIDEGTTESKLFFKQKNILDFAEADITDIDAFTPNINNSFDNITLVNVKNTATSSECLRIRYSNGFRVGKIRTFNTNFGGITVSASFNTIIEDFEGEGGTPDLQLNYGIIVQNGSKYTTIKRIKGSYYRHTFSSGGNGFAIPMFCEVVSAISNNSTSLGIDCHGNSAYFTFHNITTDYGMLIAGLGHSILNATSTFGGLNFMSSGKDCYFGNITMLAHSTMQMVNTQNGDAQAYTNCYFDNIYVEMIANAVSSKDYFWETQPWGIGNTYNNVVVVNKAFDTSKTEAQNITSLYGRTGAPITFRKNDTVNNFKLVGFPKGFIINGDNVNIGKIELEDCVWGEGTLLNVMIAISNGKNIAINRINAVINHSLNIDLANLIRITSTTVGAISNVLVQNFTYSGRAFPVGFFINNGAAGDIVFKNWNVTPPTTNTINPTPLLGLRTENIKIYPDTISTVKTGLVKQSLSVATVGDTDAAIVSITNLDTIATNNATDLPTALVLINELKAKYNLNVAITNDIKAKYNVVYSLANSTKRQFNAQLSNDVASGQKA